jgi:hypothetical protein
VTLLHLSPQSLDGIEEPGSAMRHSPIVSEPGKLILRAFVKKSRANFGLS